MVTTAAPTKDYRGAIHNLSRTVMTDWMTQLQEAAKNGTPSAYLMISGNCVEILRCFDILPVFSEINALQLVIRKNSLPYIIKSKEVGYASDNCAYVKADVGYTLCGGVGAGPGVRTSCSRMLALCSIWGRRAPGPSPYATAAR